jgi:hypothetical protein
VAEQKAVTEPEPVAQASPTASGAAPSPAAELTTDDDDTTFQIKDEIAVKLEGEWCGAIISGILGDNKIQVTSTLAILVSIITRSNPDLDYTTFRQRGALLLFLFSKTDLTRHHQLYVDLLMTFILEPVTPCRLPYLFSE